ncbi:MAG: MerR family transcriptional regulator [Gammaproteobacteria bacterium]|jgi:chaperone modulatory protein CbpM|nr:MerR family transcriptional regulator [Gammaproteobacteria bacterium]
MTKVENDVLSGKILEEDSEVTLAQLCEACAVRAEAIEAMMEEGIVAPTDVGVSKWRFTRSSVVRVRTVLRMQRDLNVNLAGAALALDLLERIEALQARLRAFDPGHRG